MLHSLEKKKVYVLICLIKPHLELFAHNAILVSVQWIAPIINESELKV